MMRKCVLGCWLIAGLSLFGCEAFYRKGPNGEKSTAQVVQGVAESFGPWGEAVSLAIGLAGTAFGVNRHAKHKKTVKENHQLRAKLPPTIPPGSIPPVPPT